MNLMDGLSNFMERYLYWFVPTSITVTDIIEILIIAFLFYEILAWFKATRAWNLLKGIMFIAIFLIVAAFLQMNTILWLAGKLVNVGIIAIIVVFQPELRNALESLGRKKIFSSIFAINSQSGLAQKAMEKTVDEIVEASELMGNALTGALIVFEKDTILDEFIRTGIDVDAAISRQLLLNIFEHNTPLHDGAVIIRNNRVASATCYLPLSDNMEISKDLGTRHRAALGMSEISDSLTVVVSEETGHISVAQNGVLQINLTAAELKERLMDFLKDELAEKKEKKKFIRRAKDHEETDE